MRTAIRRIRPSLSMAGAVALAAVPAFGQAGTWASAQPLPSPRDALCVVAVDSRLYAIGGYDGSNQFLGTNEEYDPVADQWTEKASMPTPRRTLAAGVIGGKIYVAGGWQGHQLNTLEAYDPATDTWTSLPGMPTSRDSLAAAALDDRLYVIGGSNGGSALSQVEMFDPATNTWTSKAPLPVPTWNLTAAAANGKLYAIGGANAGTPMYANVFEYDPATDAWTARANLPTPRGYLGSFVVHSAVYAIGGTDGHQSVGTVEAFDPLANAWSTSPGMPTPREYVAGAAIGSVGYAVGGHNASGPSAANETFTLSSAPPTANAGADQSIHAGQTVTFDGSGSFSDNTPTPDLAYAWTLVSMPAGSAATLAGATTEFPTMVADVPGAYVVALVVTDQMNVSSSVALVHVSSLNQPPTADAGSDRADAAGAAVTLDGSGSSDPDHDPLAYAWTIVAAPSGSSAQLVGDDTAAPSLTPDVVGQYTLQLVVSDGFTSSVPDRIVLTVVTPLRYAEDLTLAVVQTSKTLPVGDFSNAGNKKGFEALLIDAANAMQHDQLRDAQRDLQDALSRTDGWALRGRADATGSGRDWVTDSTTSLAFYASLLTALADITVNDAPLHGGGA